MGVFKKGQDWWIDYYVNGRRKREKIGPNKRLAETVLQKRKVEIAEGKFLDKRKEVNLTFNKLMEFYLRFSAKHKRSHKRDLTSANALLGYFGDRKAAEVTPSMIEDYKAQRLQTISRRGRNITPATVNRELACMKHAYSKAVQDELLEANPVKMVKMCKENNVRDRVLSKNEFERLQRVSPPHLKPINLMGYYTAMRIGEILKLNWEQIDFRKGIIQLYPEDTKTLEGRYIPLNGALTNMLLSLTRHLKSEYVFCKADGSPYKDLKESFHKACHEAGIEDFVFHDFRHTAITNMRRAGIDLLTIMRISGHKTMSVFKRYNTIDENDLRKAAARLDTYVESCTDMDTNMDTSNTKALINQS